MVLRILFGEQGRGRTESFPPTLAHPAAAGGRVRQILDKCDIPNPTFVNSTIALGRIHSSCVLSPSSQLFTSALGAGVTLSVGDANAPAGLVSGQSVAAAGSFSALAAQTSQNFPRRLWQHLNYASDPGREIDLIATILGATVATPGWITWNLQFCED